MISARALVLLGLIAAGAALPTGDAPKDMRSLLFGNFHHQVHCPEMMTMSTKEVLEQQKIWGDKVVAIGAAYTANPNGTDHVMLATRAASEIYAYDHLLVMFKPTLASEVRFRPNPGDALSYFVGGDHGAQHVEDNGFAVTPWKSVVFHNHGIYCSGDVCNAMGVYDFTYGEGHEKYGQIATVEYTFGYKKFAPDGDIRIFLHHSSLPFMPTTE